MAKKLIAAIILLCTLAALTFSQETAYAAEKTAGADGALVSAFNVNLRDFPLFVRAGFDPAEVNRIPELSPESGLSSDNALSGGGSPWYSRTEAFKKGGAILARDIPNLPKRRFLDPRGLKEMDFTYVIPFTLDAQQLGWLSKGDDMPALFLESLGDNWEIYLNGRSIKREIHLDPAGRIVSHRSYRQILMPLDKSLLGKENILTFRIVGDPSFFDVGFYFADSYQLGDYDEMSRRNSEAVTIALVGVYLFMGIYHIFMFFVRRKDKHNLYYGLFSMILGLYILVRTHTICLLIPDRLPMMRMEFVCLFLVLPLGAAFIESISRKRILLVTKIYGIFYVFLAALQLFFSPSFSLDILLIWEISAIGVVLFILIMDIGYGLWITGRDLRSSRALKGEMLSLPRLAAAVILDTPLGNLTMGALICAGTAIFDIIDSIHLHLGLTLTRYGFFVFTAGTTLILAKRFASLYSQQQRIIDRSNKGMNAKLVDWIVVQDKDPQDLPSVTEDNAIMFTDIRSFTNLSEHMDSRELTDFLAALNEILAKPLFEYQDQGYVAYTDKFMGDGTMNIFTDPELALHEAISLRQQLAIFNADPKRYFSRAPEGMRVNVGTGIAWGPVTLGIMGHSRRVDYTPIGDTVNLASRLESLTKEYRVSVLVNDRLYDAIHPERFNLRYIDRIRVKGKEKPVGVYEDYSSNSPRIRELKRDNADKLKELQEMYFSGSDWENAIKLADSMIAQIDAHCTRYGLGADNIGDFLPNVYARRMRLIIAQPGEKERWDGVFTFTGK